MPANSVISKQTLLDIVTSFTSGGSAFKLRLFSNNFTPTLNSVYADFTECTFTGYASITISLFDPAGWYSQGAAVQYANPTGVFSTASPYTVGEVVYGWYISEGVSPLFICGGLFATPIPMVGLGDQIIVNAPLGIADAGVLATVI